MELLHWEEKGRVLCSVRCPVLELFSQSEERLPMKFSKLVEFVSKKPIPPHVKHLVVEVMVSDEEGEDVEVFIWNFLCLQKY